ncbi:MAG TPA: GH92 family glycosyl hydrolase [Pyrinomonadaceae bacterium]
MMASLHSCITLILVCSVLLAGFIPAASQISNIETKTQMTDLTRDVDPFIGTGGHGHTYPGATVPFGMVQLSPDTRLTGWDGCSGYHYSDKAIYGFSHTHLSGTGISDYGDILFMPALSFSPYLVTAQPQYSASFSHENETASPGFYSVKLDDGIRVELTATARVGFHRYTFPADSREAVVMVDLKHRDRLLDSDLRIVDNTHVEGFRRSTGWAKNQIVYFAAEFSKPFELSDAAQPQGPHLIKTIFKFANPEQLLVKVGISSVSIEGAKKNLQTEISDWNFDRVHSDAVAAWNKELNKIQVAGGSDDQLKTFYTALYHTAITPNLFMDVDRQYLGHDGKIHKTEGWNYYTVFSLWDTFRAAHPLYNIIDQKRSTDFIKTFLAQYKEGGRLPVWELAGNETDTMIGYHAVSVIADAMAKGATGFDRELAFEAMKHSAELRHFGLGSYVDHGYIDMGDERESVSKTLEYAYDDWCIAMMAKSLGRTEDYNRYLRRAQFFKNVFDRESGFVRPRTNAGWLSPFEPREVNFSFTEANSWQYSFFVPQDISGLIELMGGEQKFAQKLDELFTAESQTTGRNQVDITGLIGQYAHGNEPSHHVAYLYDYARQPWKAQARLRQIMDQFYKAEPDGLIGNEDCGQMSAWYVLSAAGFYPVTPGSDIYAIGTPLFPELRFNLENGKSFVVKARNVSSKNFYIQSATLNGKPYRKSFLHHKDLAAGGELIFEMGDKPNMKWGTGPGDAPVSEIPIQKIVAVPAVKTSNKTFVEHLEVAFQPSDPGVGVYFTTDGSDPDTKSKRFTRSFFIDRTTTIKAKAIYRNGEASQTVTATYLKMPHSWSLTLKSKYSSQYPGGGEFALIDGIRGTTNFSGGAWQGYQGKDLVAVVDLGTMQSVSKLGAGFLQDVGSWILMPVKIEFEVSTDGVEFVPVLSLASDVSSQNYETIVKDFTGTIQPRRVRYVRMRARNFGKLPSWHAGAGGDAWIFADEIVIE